MANLALNKIATASSFVLPYEPARAVEGTGDKPIRRWLSIKLPCNMDVDLGANYCINRWVVKHMENAGWSSGYNMTDYKLQGSLDSKTWSDIDIVTGNSSKITDRTFKPVTFRYVRFYADKGIRVNPKLVSIMELEIYQAPASQYLSNLQLSAGTLNPVLAGKTTFVYTANVSNDVTSITLTPTAEDSAAKITVNGTSVASGSASTPINLNVGANTITVVVTASDNSASQTYTVIVTRACSAYLSTLVINDSANSSTPIGLTPTFTPKSLTGYVSTVDYSVANVTIIPTPEDNRATVKVTVNGTVISGSPITGALTNLNPNTNTIQIQVTAYDNSETKTYSITVTRNHSTLLNTLVVNKSGMGGSVPTWDRTFSGVDTNPYTVKTTANYVTMVPTLQDSSSTFVIKVGGTNITQPIQVPIAGAGTKVITLEVSSPFGISSTIYTINLIRG